MLALAWLLPTPEFFLPKKESLQAGLPIFSAESNPDTG